MSETVAVRGYSRAALNNRWRYFVDRSDMHHGDGHIEVICGPMFSGKSEEIIRRLRRAVLGRQRVQAFKPAIDRRYHETRITSHGAQSIEAHAVNSAAEIEAAIEYDTQVIGIDEAQFFGPLLVPVARRLADRGVRVVIAGLDQNYRGEPFEPIPQLLAIAESISKLTAVCVQCGGEATRSHRKAGGEATVEVGGADAYEARCRACSMRREAT